ncbi:MAG: glutamine-hydrolyzing GMP synthase, partial [Candidatus Tyrphobacter sp.]
MVFILDFGAQYSQLIARRTRELGIYCEILPHDTPWSTLAPRAPKAIVLTGGPESVLVPDAPRLDPAILTSGVPVFGICYGMQLLARELGGELVKLDRAEYGPAILHVEARESALFAGVPATSRVWMSHGDSVVRLPAGFATLASTERCAVASMGDAARRIYGVQFHPEVVHTEYGRAVLANALREIAAVPADWAMESFVDESIAQIRSTLGN